MFTITTTTTVETAYSVEWTDNNGDFRDPPVHPENFFLTEIEARNFIKDLKKKQTVSNITLTKKTWLDPDKDARYRGNGGTGEPV